MKKESLLQKVHNARDKHVNLLVRNILDDPMLENDNKESIKDELYSLLYDLISTDGTVAMGIYHCLYRYLNFSNVKSNDP